MIHGWKVWKPQPWEGCQEHKYRGLIRGKASGVRKPVRGYLQISVKDQSVNWGGGRISQKGYFDKTGYLCKKYMFSLAWSTLEHHSPVISALEWEPTEAPSTYRSTSSPLGGLTSTWHPSPGLKHSGLWYVGLFLSNETNSSSAWSSNLSVTKQCPGFGEKTLGKPRGVKGSEGGLFLLGSLLEANLGRPVALPPKLFCLQPRHAALTICLPGNYCITNPIF